MTSKNISNNLGKCFPKNNQKLMHVLRLILVFHMVSQHPIKNSLEKKHMQNNMDFQRNSKVCSKLFLTNQWLQSGPVDFPSTGIGQPDWKGPRPVRSPSGIRTSVHDDGALFIRGYAYHPWVLVYLPSNTSPMDGMVYKSQVGSSPTPQECNRSKWSNIGWDYRFLKM